MESFNQFMFFASFAGTLAVFVVAFLTWRKATVVVHPEESVLRLGFGRCLEEMKQPGLHWRPSLLVPGYRVVRVSRQVDHQLVRDVHANDAAGTTLRIDVWFDYKVVDAKKSVFAVEDWKTALEQLVPHVVMAHTGNVRLETLLAERDSVAQAALREVQAEAARWGVAVESLFLQDVRVLPEISRQLFSRVAAQIERKKAQLEEEGRIAIQSLEAQTEVRIAELHARAKSMHPQAVARAYRGLATNPRVMNGYRELHQLSLLQPGRVVSFVGFDDAGLRPLDALMIPEDGSMKPHLQRTPPSH